MKTLIEQQVGLPPESSTEESKAWFNRAKRVMAGGVSSSARATTTDSLPYPLYIVRGQGARIWDADGNEFVDYLLGYGSAILGHADEGLVATLSDRLALSTMFGTCNCIEVLLAEQICQMVPCADSVRFSNSGSEAVAAAVRGARAYTGRNKILKFEGHYHGWIDVLGISNRPSEAEMGSLESPNSAPHSHGIPQGVVDDVVVCPWNNEEILRNLLDRHEGEIAAVIAEPIVANNACIMPRDGYLGFLRDQCNRRGIVLIYDEIVTGFRVARGGAQELFGVLPDIAVYSKAVGGGLPISFLAGRKEIMDLFATGYARHGGTYNSSPLCAAAALHTLKELDDDSTRKRISDAGQAAITAIRHYAEEYRVPCIVQGLESMFQVIFGVTRPAVHYRDLFIADTKRFSIFRQALLTHGVHINSSGMACWFVSAAHSPNDVQLTEAAIKQALKAVAK